MRAVAVCAILGGAPALSACISNVGAIDDGGRAQRDFEQAPPHDNDLAGSPADVVPIVDERVDTPFDGD